VSLSICGVTESVLLLNYRSEAQQGELRQKKKKFWESLPIGESRKVD